MKVLGAALILVGTSIGGAMLALPIATALGGFYHTVALLAFACVVMVVGGLFILEVCICLPEDTNLVSMAKHTLGSVGQVVTWLSYVILIYALLSAYISGGSDMLANFFRLLHVNLSETLNIIIFVLLFGFVLFKGIAAVDWVNRLLMTCKMAAYFILVALFVPSVNTMNWHSGNAMALISASAIMTAITSFGNATAIPTIRSYLNSNVKQLRWIVIVGGLGPLLVYILWVGVVQGMLGIQQLHTISRGGHAVSSLTNSLSALVHSDFIKTITHFFTSICVLTAFLGVGIGATDFFADGFKIKKHGVGNYKVVLITLLPPFLFVVFDPTIFLRALSFAGICCVVLLVLLPSLMAWFERYIKKMETRRIVPGGKVIVVLWIIISIVLLILSVKS